MTNDREDRFDPEGEERDELLEELVRYYVNAKLEAGQR